ncbi:hypothetical protein JTB14_004656 [Gonioctena quinquepunctata]|nr:hypothetical protein JTB14_004656 [Gonioctena quinquepunctata]
MNSTHLRKGLITRGAGRVKVEDTNKREEQSHLGPGEVLNHIKYHREFEQFQKSDEAAKNQSHETSPIPQINIVVNPVTFRPFPSTNKGHENGMPIQYSSTIDKHQIQAESTLNNTIRGRQMCERPNDIM